MDEATNLKLTILERKGDTFRGTLVAGDSVERTFTGTVKDATVSWLARDVQSTKGGVGGDNTGTISGNRIDFKWQAEGANGEFTLRREVKRGPRRRADRDAGNHTTPQTAPQAASPSVVVVTVDFGQRVPHVQSMSGFLQGLGPVNPPDSRIEPLQPALWRLHWGGWREDGKATLDKAGFDRLAKLKIPAIIGPHHVWHSQYGAFEKGGKFPFHDYQQWEDLVRWVARDAKAEGYELVWDIWNEPDSDVYWGGSRQQFCETFVRAANVLRQELGPKVVISGPSLAQYDPVFITEFLDYCVAHRITLPMLSWHELFVDSNIPSVTAHLVEARQRFVNNPAYRSLGIKKIHINEIIGPGAQFQPGETLGYLKALELGGADGACKSCWNDSQESLHGLLEPETMQPRAPWWAYKAYADSVSTRVRSAETDPRIVAFASRGDAGEAPAQIVIGYFALGESPPAVDVTLRLQNIRSIPSVGRKRSVRAAIRRIPNAGEQPVPALDLAGEETLRIADGSLEIRLSSLELHEGRVVTLGPD